MIFMSRDSWQAGCVVRPRTGKMRSGVVDPPPYRHHRWAASLLTFPSPSFHGVLTLQWQTPVATDLRFGFEITMYVAAR